MKEITVLLLMVFGASLHLQAQETEDCNKLGAWLWYIEITGFQTHAQIADSLSNLGVKRIYVKVADGQINPSVWPELLDEELVDTYQAAGLEVWGWSYNYPGNDSLQAEALYIAAETGYEGFVVDVEMEFDGDSTNLSNLFTAFTDAKDRAIMDGHASNDFQLYCTTWGNPIDHNYRIDVIDPFVDGFMPQTYVEVWGQTYINNQVYWIEVGNEEYEGLGATKPIHHICATESGVMTSAQINEFIQTSGPESSLWRIPGGGTPLSIWNDWAEVDWNMNFCDTVSNIADQSLQAYKVFPNPVIDVLQIQLEADFSNQFWTIYNLNGEQLKSGKVFGNQYDIDLSGFLKGIYLLQIGDAKQTQLVKLIKM